MIAQIQGLEAFVRNHLADVADWTKHVRVDPEHKTTGDQAYIVIATPFNRYKMSILSSYIDPPPGAPLQCKSLGTVTFYDPAEAKQIVGPKADLTWTDISKHIHYREYVDALAGARRELAEAPAPTLNEDGTVKYDHAAPIRVRLADLVARAAKWGIAAPSTRPLVDRRDPDHWVNKAADIVKEQDAKAAETAPVHSVGPPVVASGEAPWLGAPVLFFTNPGESISGMSEIVGWCVKVMSRDRISVFMTPDHSEPSYRDNLPRRGSDAGNGRVHQFNCWDFNPAALRELSRIRHLQQAIEKMADEGNLDRKEMAQLAARVATLESEQLKPGDLMKAQADLKAAESSVKTQAKKTA